ncbi:MAG TPA: hypothetical protein VFU24_07960 [Burkholderiales bacterium]|nr:hypothetical protein [Burkholderiales bacterium]
MAQFRVEFVVDQATGKYLAELYNPDNQQELMVRTEAIYASQAAAVLGLVQLFKDAILKFPPADAKPRVQAKQKRRRSDRAKPKAAKKRPPKKAKAKKGAKRRKHA